MIMQSADLYEMTQTNGDYGIVSGKSFIKSILCFISFGSGSIYAQNNAITSSTTHTALTQETDVQAGMWLLKGGTEYLINSVNPTGRFTILYLQAQGGVSNAN